MSNSAKFIWIHWSCYYFCNVQQSSAWVNLRVGLLLDRRPILVSSLPRATVRTLKPKNFKT